MSATTIAEIRKVAEQVYLQSVHDSMTANWIGGGQSISYRKPGKIDHHYSYVSGPSYATAAGVSNATANRHLRALASAGGWDEEPRTNKAHPIRLRPSFEYYERVGKAVIEKMAAQGMEFADVTIAKAAKAQESRKGFVIRKWLRADGDSIPAEASGPVDVEFRDGDVASYPDGESLGGWMHEGQPTDIMAWRPRPDRATRERVPA